LKEVEYTKVKVKENVEKLAEEKHTKLAKKEIDAQVGVKIINTL
jgi:hypothetical protein